jgi:hypothetical protein
VDNGIVATATSNEAQLTVNCEYLNQAVNISLLIRNCGVSFTIILMKGIKEHKVFCAMKIYRIGFSAFNDRIILNVADPPVIFAQPLDTTTNETNTITISCVLEGKPQPNVTWTKNGTDVEGDSRIRAAHPWSYGNSTATLTIANVNRSDESYYACVADNGIGANVISTAAKLTVNCKQFVSNIQLCLVVAVLVR